MQLENVAVQASPTLVCAIPYWSSGVVITNTGATSVSVDLAGGDAYAGTAAELAAVGIAVAAGATVTLPGTDGSLQVWAAVTSGTGQLTYALPG